MSWFQDSAQRGLLRSVKGTALMVARHWPWPVAATTTSGDRMFVDLRSSIGRALFMKGEFDPGVFPPLASVLKNGSVFIDVGANIGYYSVLASRLVGLSGRVYAFEVDPRPLRCLRRTLSQGAYSNVVVQEIGVGERRGEG